MSEKVTIHFVDESKNKTTLQAPVGSNVMEFAQENGIDIPGLCGGSLACSTCHVIVDDESFAKLDEATPDEEDMLDLAFDLKKTSRLSCQVTITKELDNATFYLPKK